MEIYIDLLRVRENKSVFFIALGILTIILGFFWVISRAAENLSIRLFDWFYTVAFVLNGISITIQGFGYSPARIFGKSFIKINDKELILKTGIFKKEQIIPWDDVKKIIYKINNFIISDSKNELYALNISNLGYNRVKEIKNLIRSIAEKRGLSIE